MGRHDDPPDDRKHRGDHLSLDVGLRGGRLRVGTPGSTASTAVALRTTDNGKRWVLGEALSAGITELTAIGLPVDLGLRGGGDSALAVQTTDGGARWVSETLPAGAAGVEAIACPRPGSARRSTGTWPFAPPTAEGPGERTSPQARDRPSDRMSVDLSLRGRGPVL